MFRNPKWIILLSALCLMSISETSRSQESASALLKPMERLSPSSSFYGELNLGRLGYYLSRAGDVNRDGYDDFMIAGYHHHVHGWNSGGVYLFLGKSTIDWSLNMLVGQAASALFCGYHDYDFTGYNIDGGGDFNGDGLSDMLIGAPGNWDREPPFPGKAFIVLGRENADWGMNFVLEYGADEDFLGERDYDQFGYAVSFIGDLNQDGYDEILCSAAFKNLQYSWQGKVYLIAGNAQGYPRGALAAESAVASFIYPANEANVGSAVAGVGDVNKDGIPDFAIGAAGIGRVFLLFGRTGMDWGNPFNLTNADVVFLPEDAERDDSGWQVKGVNDVNGDAIDDFLISGLQINNDAGKTYLILGRENWPARQFYLSQADASFLGEGSEQHSGVSIAGVNDFNGDNYNDFMIGARYYSGGKYHRGKAYVVTGKSGGWQRNVPLSEIEINFVGQDTIHCAGWGVSGAGDVNADGCMDILTSAPFNSEFDKWAGEIYLFLGDYNVLSLTGKVAHVNGFSIAGAMVKVTANGTFQTLTDISGEYRFRFSPCNSVTVSATKTEGAESASTAISAYDAALAAQFAVGLRPLDAIQQSAADANSDGKVGCFDAALIAQYAVGLNLVPSSQAGGWFFEPKSYFYQSLYSDKMNVNFTAGIRGDVDGNWQGAGELKRISPSNEVHILPDKIDVNDQSTVVIPIQLTDYNKVISADIEINYPADVLEFAGIAPTNFSRKFATAINNTSAGLLRIAMYTMGQPCPGEELRLQFTVLNRNYAGVAPVSLTDLRVDNKNAVADETTLFFGTGQKPLTPVSVKNLPNPFNPETTIHVTNAVTGHGSVNIFDVLGRKVREFDLGVIQPGEQKILWNGRDEYGQDLASGVYLLQFRCGADVTLNKMIKIK
ncbi:MAG: FlgD immunoglobulin-like domain containing protein [Candidatus Zhuqueibacterota bacterium]